jgi:hypothetical protein
MLEVLFVLVVAFGLFVVLPLLILKAVFGVALWCLLLPFKVLGGLVELAVGLAVGLGKIAVSGAAVLAILLGLVLCVVLVPLLPLAAIAFGVFVLVKFL